MHGDITFPCIRAASICDMNLWRQEVVIMEDKRVDVRIYGQDYIVSGERDEQTIVEIAAYVDARMRETARYFSGGSQGSLAVLAAVNIADEFFESRERLEELTKAKEQMEKDARHYMKMWDEAKKSFMQYKEEAARAADERRECEEKCRSLEARCSELESAYFDLQMENVQLKNELEKLQRDS